MTRRTSAAPRPFIVNVAMLAGVQAMGQALILLAYPALTRVYTPAEFGVLGAFEAALAILVALCTFRYHSVIPLIDDDHAAWHMVCVAVVVLSTFSVLIAFVVSVASAAISHVLHSRLTATELTLLPLGVWCAGCCLIAQAWLVRSGRLARVAGARWVQGVVQPLTQLGFGWSGGVTIGLLWGLVAGRAAAVIALIRWRSASTLLARIRGTRPGELWGVAWRYRGQPIWSSASALLGIIGQQASVLFLSSQHSAEDAGWFTLAFTLVLGPIFMLSYGIEQTFAATFARESPVRVARHAARLCAALIATVLPAAMLFVVLAPDLFAVAFGARWVGAGHCAALLMPMGCVIVVGAHLPWVVLTHRRQRLEFGFNVVLLLLRAMALAAGGAGGDALWTVTLFSAVSALALLLYNGFVLTKGGANLAGIGRASCRAIVVGTVAIAVVMLGRWSALGWLEWGARLGAIVLIAIETWRASHGFSFSEPESPSAGERI